MKRLAKARGLRDCSLIEVTLHIANLAHQFKEDRKIFENEELSHDARAEAYTRMLKAKDLLSHWKEIRKDILRSKPVESNITVH